MLNDHSVAGKLFPHGINVNLYYEEKKFSRGEWPHRANWPCISKRKPADDRGALIICFQPAFFSRSQSDKANSAERISFARINRVRG